MARLFHQRHPSREALREQGQAMKPITRILVPIDFSSHSEQALGWAIELAQRYRSTLWIMHAHEPTGYMMPGGYISATADILELERKARENKVLAARTRALEAGVGVVETFLLPGSAASEIVRVAEEGCCGLIVMGTHGRMGLEHAFFGSVAEQVARRAPCPVVTTRAAD
jgi:nucleotide-binding universal stress UspA family protein